jgi:hypothetical protein
MMTSFAGFFISLAIDMGIRLYFRLRKSK